MTWFGLECFHIFHVFSFFCVADKLTGSLGYTANQSHNMKSW